MRRGVRGEKEVFWDAAGIVSIRNCLYLVPADHQQADVSFPLLFSRPVFCFFSGNRTDALTQRASLLSFCVFGVAECMGLIDVCAYIVHVSFQ